VFCFIGERFADLQMLRYQVPCFENLNLRQKKLLYYLGEAALWGRDILWDQNGACNLRIRRLLESVFVYYPGDRECEEFRGFVTYLKRVWFSNGIHHHYSYDKLEPGFPSSFLHEALTQIPKEYLPLCEGESLDALEKTLFPVIFDPDVMPKRLNQKDGDDLVETSSCNYYGADVTQSEAEEFYARQKRMDGDTRRPVMYGLNSRLEKTEGTLVERVWRCGGMYGSALEHVVEMLEKALPHAENERQKEVIATLVDFYRTGDLETFDRYTIQWVKETEGDVDFVNGFTEVYGDPLGLKASWEGYVNILDNEASDRTRILSDHAQWFEDHSPVDARFRKEVCRGVTARVVEAAILGGDLYPSSAIGINLPNSNWVRAEHGSKSVTIGNLTHAYSQAARGNGFRQEFVVDGETLSMLDRYGEVCDNLHTDLHECLGHGSGRLLPGVDADAMKAYGNTIEEARADLFGLYYMADLKMVELGLLPCMEAYKAHYYSYMMNGLLTQMVRIAPGHVIEEAHMRNRALIAYWTLDHYPRAVRMARKEEKTYVEVLDYEMLRTAFATLLREVQRIKSEGDYEAARLLVEEYGIRIDASLHQEIRDRYQRLDLAPYKGFINPRYTVERDSDGEISDVHIEYGESYTEQMLRYSREYDTKL